jgi:hypothetical protein
MTDSVAPGIVTLLEGSPVVVPGPPLALDDEVVVAVWRRDSVAAALYVWHDPDDSQEPFAQDVELFEKENGNWRSLGRGGTDWPINYGERPSGGKPFLTGYCSGAQAKGGYVWVATGVAPCGVDRVRLLVEGYRDIVDVESTTGAFLVAVPAPDEIPLEAVTVVITE